MIEYPPEVIEGQHHDNCFSAEEGPDERQIKIEIAAGRVIGKISGSLDAMMRNAERQGKTNSDLAAEVAMLYRKLEYAEEQEAICGMIATGDLNKIDEQRAGFYQLRKRQYRKFTDSQKAVNLLLEAKNAAYSKLEVSEKVNKEMQTLVNRLNYELNYERKRW